MEWFILALLAALSYGLQNFLYKVAAEKRLNAAWTTFSMMLTVAFFGMVLFFLLGKQIENVGLLLGLSLFASLSFCTSILLRIEVLKYIPASVSFPIIRMGVVIVVLFSIFYFKETLSFFQVIGIILAISVAFILSKNEKKDKMRKNYRLGVLLLIFAVLVSVGSNIAVKFVAINLDIVTFLFVSYTINTFYSLGLSRKLQGDGDSNNHGQAIILGIIIGFANLVGIFLILSSLKTGPLSIVNTINSLSFVIPIILSIILYGEHITRRRVLGFILSILAVVLLGIN